MDSHPKSFFRRDIEGLRAVAVLLVLAFHAGLPLPGGFVGVDLFFVISGFLITSLMLREVESTGTVSLVNFYARRARRLLPAATLVLLGASLCTRWLAPSSQRSEFGWDIATSATYVVNWRLASRSVDYLAEDVGRSPVLHFWSLSVEEQFYLLWPLLILVGIALARRFRFGLRPSLGAALGLVCTASLAWSILFSRDSPREAFFVTTTRFWELGIGSALALSSPQLAAISARKAYALSAVGAGLVGVAALWADAAKGWPGYGALVPALGAALLIAGGSVERSRGASALLSAPPMVRIGALSYSLYLWHWPLLVVAQDWLQLRGWFWGLVVTVSSVLPAWLTHRYVESPIRFNPRFDGRVRAQLLAGVAASLFCASIGAFFVARRTGRTPPRGEANAVRLDVRAGKVRATPERLGAGVLTLSPPTSSATHGASREPVPRPNVATKDVPNAYGRKCQASFERIRPTWCLYGDERGETDVVVVGDSKVLQYIEAIDAIGKAHGWKIRSATKSSCAFTAALTTRDGEPYRECQTFYEEVMEQLSQRPPKIVITSQHARVALATQDADTSDEESMVRGLTETWGELRSRGIEVLVVLDNLNARGNPAIYQCVADHPTSVETCAFEKKEATSAARVQEEAARAVPGVKLIDLNDLICPEERCPPVIGGVLVYRQTSHLTNTYARSLAPMLEERLLKALRK